MKRKISILLIMVMLSLSVSNAFCITSKADTVDDVRNDIYWALTHAAGTMGYIFGPNARDAIYDFACNSLSWIPVYEETGQAEGVTYDATTGLITMNAAVMQELKDCIEEYFTQEENVPDILWIPVISSDDFSVAHFSTTTQYYQYRSYADDIPYTFVHIGKNGALYMKDMSEYVYCDSVSEFSTSTVENIRFLTENWGDNGYSNSYTLNDGTTKIVYDLFSGYTYYADGSPAKSIKFDKAYNSDGEIEVTHCLSNTLGQSGQQGNPRVNNPWGGYTVANWYNYGFLVYGCNTDANVYIPYFPNVTAYKEWVVGQADYYQLTPTYQGGDITVNPNIDYGKLYDAVSAAMSNSAANGENVTQQLSAMQDAYEATMQEISGTLGDIEDNTEQSNSWLEKIYNNTASIASILIEQFDAMTETINNGFASVVDGLSDVSLGLGEIGDGSGGGSDSGGGSKLSFWDKVGNFFGSTLGGIFDLIELIVMKALDGVAWLADKLVDNLGKALNGVTEIMDRYTKKITENNTLSKLGEAIPPELKDLLTFFFFGVIGAGVIRAAKK